MQQVFETEVFGSLTAEQFASFKDRFDKELGTAKHAKRLAMQISDFTNKQLDTRIRITNGKAEIMQKVGSWDAKTRQELSVSLPNDPEVILRHWQVLSHMLVGPMVQWVIIQMESYTYHSPGYEVKLTHQTGKEDAYNFEVEALDHDGDLLAVCEQFGLKPDLGPADAAYWDAFNKRVNLDARDLTGDELLAIIAAYC